MLVQDGFLYLIVTRHKLTVFLVCLLFSFLEPTFSCNSAFSSGSRLKNDFCFEVMKKLEGSYGTGRW